MFKRGDKVRLKETSEFFGGEGQVPAEGGTINGDNGHGKFHVIWADGGYNLYDPRELELIPSGDERSEENQETATEGSESQETKADETESQSSSEEAGEESGSQEESKKAPKKSSKSKSKKK